MSNADGIAVRDYDGGPSSANAFVNVSLATPRCFAIALTDRPCSLLGGGELQQCQRARADLAIYRVLASDGKVASFAVSALRRHIQFAGVEVGARL